jgi:hypothetical protein
MQKADEDNLVGFCVIHLLKTVYKCTKICYNEKRYKQIDFFKGE